MAFDRTILDSLLIQVERPGRYLGNERGAVRKDPRSVGLRFALCFPEVYEIAQSHPGMQILYDLLNRRSDVYAERAYAPWIDLEALLRRHGQPLVSLETFTPLCDFDVLGFSLQYELTYTNLLNMLDLGGAPLLAAERSARDPLVIAGGPCAFNPEPLADFLDAVVLGDGEQAVGDICDVVLGWDGRDRSAVLAALARLPGVYVPSLYRPEYDAAGRLVATRPVRDDLAAVVEKRVLADLNVVPLQHTYVVPNMKVVHGRPSLEVMRGCVKGCRFCQAGYIYRPLRERDPRRVLEQAAAAVAATGTDELSLLSLSTGDYSCVNPLLTELMNRYAPERIAVSLPSTRVDALAPSLLEQIRRVRKTGFTLAPEAGTQRMRDIIQKEYDEAELIAAAQQIFQLGWRALKLYFMLGLPGETEEDLLGIVDLSARVAAAGPRRAEVTASVSTFVPKPHTPFQWAAQIDLAETESRQALLRRALHRRGLRFKWHDARASYLEGIISRGDRRIGALLIAAHRLGCRFDGWTETCRLDLWERALAETGIDAQKALGRRQLDEPLPWDHIGSGVSKKFLQRELARAVEGLLTPDCSVERCTYCGACDFKRIRNVDYHVAGAKGSDHRGGVIDNWARVSSGSGEAIGSWEPRGWHKIRERRRERAVAKGNDPAALLAGASVAPAARAAEHGAVGLGNAEEWLAASRERLGTIEKAASPPARMRLRLTYAKTGRARFISHLEIIDVFSSAARRAALPVAFSQGHRPAPRFRFGPGLPLGTESDCELLDIDFTEPVEPGDLVRRLSEQLPEGMAVLAAVEIPLRSKSIEDCTAGYCYRIGVGALIDGDGAWIDLRLEELIGSESFPVRRRTGHGEKIVDARPLVVAVGRQASEVELHMRFGRDGSLKPAELIAAVLGLGPEQARLLPVRKTKCFLLDPRAGEAAAAAVAP